MLTANEKAASILIDLPGRVLPLPSTGLEFGDLAQLAGKPREFYTGEVTPTAPTPTTAVDAFIPTLRRRRR